MRSAISARASRREVRAIVGDALRIRRWVLPGLFDGVFSGPPPVSSTAAWTLFLRAEACALFLDRSLRSAGIALGAEARECLEVSRMLELQRAMSAQGQLRGIATLAERCGWKVVALKGGVAIGQGVMIDVADVDVLVLPEVAAPLASELEETGRYERLGSDLPVGAPGWAHLASRLAPGGIQVEIHYAVRGLGPAAPVIARSVPLSVLPILRMPNPEDHMFHLLWHATVQHPERHGRIRDLQMMGIAYHACSEAERGAVERRAEAEREAAEITKLLDFVSHGSGERGSPDPFATTASLRYLLYALPSVHSLPRRLERYLARSVYLVERRGGAVNRWLGDLQNQTDAPVSDGFLRRFSVRAPLLIASALRTYRTGAVLASLPTAWSLVKEAERIAAGVAAEG